jgi:hypothetical protein
MRDHRNACTATSVLPFDVSPMLRALGLLLLAAAATGCVVTARPVPCTDVDVLVARGRCTEIGNTCSDPPGHPLAWLEGDAFTIAPSIDGISVDTRYDDFGVRHHSLCAATDVPLYQREESYFQYGAFNGQSLLRGYGKLYLGVVHGLSVTAGASPARIAAGDTASLSAEVAGGVPPYHYAWTPSSTLSSPDSAEILVRPTATTRYRVAVTDASGDTATADAVVEVFAPALTVSFSYALRPASGGLYTLSLEALTSAPVTDYAWDLGWTPEQPDLHTLVPAASFSIREGTRGTVTLTVTGPGGATATAQRTVP